MSAQVLEPLRIAGKKVILPDAATKLRMARHLEGKLIGSFKLCLSAAGDVVSVERLRSTGFPAYDATIEARHLTVEVSAGDRKPARQCRCAPR